MPAEIKGYVVDNRRRPIAKAKVSLKGKVVTGSGDDGYFSITLPKPESRVALTFSSEGYVTNTKVYDSRAKTKYVVIMWPIAYRCRFDSTKELDIELGGSRIRVPANALVIRGTKKLAQPVNLQFTPFDVTSPFQRAAAPGDFSGKMLDGSVQRLNSWGIFDLSATDPTGKALTLRPKAKIELSLAIPPRLVKDAPRKMGFFNFDPIDGRWIQISNFNFSPKSLTYNGWIVRFGGEYNLDDPQLTTCVTIRVVNVWDGAPMNNATVVAHGFQYDSYGTTNSNGLVCLLVQRNASFTVEAWGTIGNSDYTTYPWDIWTFTSPDFSANEDDCGDPERCPLLGAVTVDIIVGGLLSNFGLAIQRLSQS